MLTLNNLIFELWCANFIGNKTIKSTERAYAKAAFSRVLAEQIRLVELSTRKWSLLDYLPPDVTADEGTYA